VKKPRVRRDPRGEWWAKKFADLVESRSHMTVPEFAPRKGRRTVERGPRKTLDVKREDYTTTTNAESAE
jgi:hypothetical protein